MQPVGDRIYEAIIIGAGPAGLGAAAVFEKEQMPYLILEARMRIGGRVLTQLVDDVRIDLGASWIHSYSKTNPLRKYVAKFGIKPAQLAPKGCGRMYYDGELCREFTDQAMDYAAFNQCELTRTVAESLSQSDHDLSIWEAAKPMIDRKWSQMED